MRRMPLTWLFVVAVIVTGGADARGGPDGAALQVFVKRDLNDDNTVTGNVYVTVIPGMPRVPIEYDLPDKVEVIWRRPDV